MSKRSAVSISMGTRCPPHAHVRSAPHRHLVDGFGEMTGDEHSGNEASAHGMEEGAAKAESHHNEHESHHDREEGPIGVRH